MDTLPKGRKSVLDVGARDGRVSRLLTGHFESVTALDLERPNIPGVVNVKGNATHLEFGPNSFDTVVCSEVLEHIPFYLLPKTCQELSRVARYDLIVGVPYKQDLRFGQTTCASCGKINPPWGHVNSFNEKNLCELFKPLTLKAQTFVGLNKAKTNIVSARLMSVAGNPWGTYDQKEACIHCGNHLIPPTKMSLLQEFCAKAAYWANQAQRRFVPVSPNWIHVVFQKREFGS